MKTALNRLITNEKGQALPLVLILLVIGGLIIGPLLAYISSGLKTGEIYEEKMARLYAADSGVEDALWKIKNEQLPDWMKETWDDAVYSHDPYTYSLSPVNDKNVNVEIQPIWLLVDLGPECLGDNPPETTRPHEDMVVVGDFIGTADGNGLYQISINYDQSKGPMKLEIIGAWLPPGFGYVAGTSNLGFDPTLYNLRGGTALVWDYSPSGIKFEDLPGSGDKRIVTFQFTPNQNPQSAFSWIRTKRMDVALSWDIDCKIYKVTSQATDVASGKSTTVEAYSVKNELRKMASTLCGDYFATGNTLMTATSTGYNERFRDRLYQESSATIAADDIPSSATVEAAYLYWSGWIDYHYKYESEGLWYWGEIDALKYPDDPTPENLATLVEESAKVNRVLFGITDNMTQITADEWQVVEDVDQPDTSSYSCFFDATDQIKQLIDNGDLGSNGSGTYILSHVPEDRAEFSYELYNTGETTGYPLGTPATRLSSSSSYPNRYQWAYAGWSLIIIYSSPETKGHQLYLFDDLRYVGINTVLQFPVSGFLAPDDTTGSHLTYFVGEGDEHYSGDHIELNGSRLSDAINPSNNVFNSYSNALDDPFLNGIDIDTFDISNYVASGDISAEVELDNGSEIYNLIYIILSFRSKITTSGTISYSVR